MSVGPEPSWLVSLQEEKTGTQMPTRKFMGGHREKTTISKPRREVSEETCQANTLVWDL